MSSKNSDSTSGEDMTVAAAWKGSPIAFAIAKVEEPIGDSASAEKEDEDDHETASLKAAVSGEIISGAAAPAAGRSEQSGIMATSTKALLLVKPSAAVNSERMVDGFIIMMYCSSSVCALSKTVFVKL